MSYAWNDAPEESACSILAIHRGQLIVSQHDDFGGLDLGWKSINLPTDPDEVVKLLRAIAIAAGVAGTVVVGRVDR